MHAVTLSDQMVEAAKDVLFKRGIVDTFTVREALTAALALAEAEAGAVFMRWPPDGDDVQACADEVNPYAETTQQYGLTVEMVCDIIEAWKRRAATLAGRVWP